MYEKEEQKQIWFFFTLAILDARAEIREKISFAFLVELKTPLPSEISWPLINHWFCPRVYRHRMDEDEERKQMS